MTRKAAARQMKPNTLMANELTATGRTDVENVMQEMVDQVLHEPRIPTMGKKLIIEASTPGHYPGLLWERVGLKNMPPTSIEEQVAAIIACVKAGAAAIHTHPRDPSAPRRYQARVGKGRAASVLAEILDGVYRNVDVVPLNHAWHPKNWVDLADADFIEPTKEMLDLGKGNKYIQGNIVPTWVNPRSRSGLLSSWFSADALKQGIPYLEKNNVKPLIALHADHFVWFKENILDAGILKTRPHFNIQEGKHGVNRSFADPSSHLNLIATIEAVRKSVPDCTIGIHAGGRNWLPMTVLAIMLGVDLVRVGIEDQFWAYPHKDEFIKSAVESVERVAAIAKALGRDLATADEARKILGIKLTKKRAGARTQAYEASLA